VEDSAMLELIRHSKDLEHSCEELIEAAKRGGSDDNITCLLLRAHEQSWSERLLNRLASSKDAQQSSL
jgi:serine/threonine protein phosphatase PrpC